MWALRVLKPLTLPDGRIFEPGHDCKNLEYLEMAELLKQYPDHFEEIPDDTPPPVPLVRVDKPAETPKSKKK